MSEEGNESDSNHFDQKSTFNPLPQPGVYWKKKKEKEIGEDQPDKIWLSVGRALTSYEHLEEQLAQLFDFFVESKSRAGIKAYGVVTGGRNNLLTEAGSGFFERRNGYLCDVEEFRTLQKHHSFAASFRNEVAHGIVRQFRVDEKETQSKWLLVSPSYNTRKIIPLTDYRYHTYRLEEVGSKYFYTSDAIDNFSAKCGALTKRLHYFLVELIQVYDHDVHTGFTKAPQIFVRPDLRRMNDDKSHCPSSD